MNAIRSPDPTLRSGAALARAGLIDTAEIATVDAVAARYAVAVTPHLAGLIAADDSGDAMARQFLPDPGELVPVLGERSDPIGDTRHSPVKGIVHRYPDRALLMPTSVCAVYCRFCFRRETVGAAAGALTPDDLDRALAYIESHAALREVILTGGDPLVLSDRRLGSILDRLEAVPHVETVRIHTRVPVAEPARITPALARLLDRVMPIWVSLHCNHPKELVAETRVALRLLGDAAVPLLAQTVLLKGVNDDVATLEALFRDLIACRVKPYYLHHPDLAPGTARFRLSIEQGRSLMRALRGCVPGHALPTYVVDIPGGAGKVPIGPDYVDVGEDGVTVIIDPRGDRHEYPAHPLDAD